VVIDAPGAAAHGFSPAADAQVVSALHVFNDRVEVLHAKRDIGKFRSSDSINAQNTPRAVRNLRMRAKMR
jgi:hypothetical protein